MNFRNLLTAISVFVVVVYMNSTRFSYTAAEANQPRVIVRGLVMLQLERKDALYIATPDASDHHATITIVTMNGQTRTVAFKGHHSIAGRGTVDSVRNVQVPELIRMKELYGPATAPLLDRASNQISIPWAAIKSVRTRSVTDARYTFVRQDTGEEVSGFRPRQVAESIEIELNPSTVLILNGARINLSDVKEVQIEQVPKDMGSVNTFQAHFHHYLHYIARPLGENFDVQPRKLTGGGPVPRVGNSFWIGAYILCDPVAVD